LVEKFRTSVSSKLPPHRFAALDRLINNAPFLAAGPLHEFMELLTR
jgi:hypothetical protein